ncbi:MAG: hypothetical protein BM563_06200 [Bacteroidetes bacterium MedPE-SWsnd-G1]|nr:MAG: hypothetical protein BM563_06200 [Bacteroidetes bacterium MedPE-SWsnd-G1]
MLVLASFTTTSNSNAKKILGTWSYEVPDAPYDYQEGDLIFEKADGELNGYAKIGGYKTEVDNLVVDGKNVTFSMYVEETEVEFDLEFDKKSFKGTVSYVEGTLDISGSKK